MDFTLNNGLSMIGGDDFTTIYEEIDTLNDTVVFKAGAQTITGNKTITGDLVVNNIATTMTANDTKITGGTVELLATGANRKYYHDSAATSITNASVYISDTAALPSGFIISGGSVATQAPITGTIAQEIGVNTKQSISNTTTTLTNGTTNIVSGVVNKVAISATDTILTNDTTTIVCAGDTKANITSSDTTLTNTTTNIVSGANNKVAISGTATTLTNTTTNIVSGVATKYTQNATTTTISNNTLINTATVENRMECGATYNGITITPTDVGIASGEYYMTATTGNLNGLAADTVILDGTLNGIVLAAGGTQKATLSTTATTLTNTTTNILSGAATKYTNNATITSITNGTINLQSAAGVNRLTQTATSTTITNDTVVLEIADGTNKYSHTTGTSTLSNATINMNDGTTTRFTQNNGTTTLTNTSVNVVGDLYAEDYFVGRSTSTNYRLASFQLPLGTCLIPNATGAGTTTTTGAWSYTGTSTQMRTPNWGRFYPLYAMIGLDGGSFTNTLTTTLSVQIREETNNYTLATTPFTITSGTSNATSGGTQAFTVFSDPAREYITDGVLIRFQIVVVRQATISASTKSVYATVYGYQTI